jgi:predicted methyltransferase
MPPLTEQAHELIRQVIRPGDIAIDATAGNGHDTLFLARQVGPEGTVFAFDVQQAAIDSTAALLEISGVGNVALVKRTHAELVAAIPSIHHGRVTVVMFNLGYLPGGCKLIATTTQAALDGILAGSKLLRAGGMMTVLAYTGHVGGSEEALAVEQLLGNFSRQAFEIQQVAGEPGRIAAPKLFVIRRLSEPPPCVPN